MVPTIFTERHKVLPCVLLYSCVPPTSTALMYWNLGTAALKKPLGPLITKKEGMAPNLHLIIEIVKTNLCSLLFWIILGQLTPDQWSRVHLGRRRPWRIGCGTGPVPTHSSSECIITDCIWLLKKQATFTNLLCYKDKKPSHPSSLPTSQVWNMVCILALHHIHPKQRNMVYILALHHTHPK